MQRDNHMTAAYIFDYGGTLDTGGNHWGKVIWHAYEQCGVPVDESSFRAAYVHAERPLAKHRVILPTFTFHDTLCQKILIEFNYLLHNRLLTIPASEAEALRQQVVHTLYQGVKAETQRSLSVVAQLSEKYPLVLVSNFYGNVSVVLEEFGFSRYFPHIIESAVVGIRKPNPLIFALGVEALGLQASEVVVVGDSYDKDIVPAKNLGCQTVWFKGEGWTADEPDGAAADRIISNLSELL